MAGNKRSRSPKESRPLIRRTLAASLAVIVAAGIMPVNVMAAEKAADSSSFYSSIIGSESEALIIDAEASAEAEKPMILTEGTSIEDVLEDHVSETAASKDDLSNVDVSKDDDSKGDVSKDDDSKGDVSKSDVSKDGISEDAASGDDSSEDDALEAGNGACGEESEADPTECISEEGSMLKDEMSGSPDDSDIPAEAVQTVSVEILWETDGSQTELINRPESVEVTLEYTADGGNTWQPYLEDPQRVIVPSENGWEAEWKLPAADEDGREISFRAKETELTLYRTTISTNKGEDKDTGEAVTRITIINTYRDSWNYAIDLSWDTASLEDRYEQEDVTLDIGDIELKYQLTISANDKYDAGELQVRLPYAIWKDRNNKAVVPSSQQVSVPKAPDKNAEYAFNYEIDDHGTEDPLDDEIVFINREPIATGFKQTLTVGYTVDPMSTVDCSEVELTAKGEGRADGQNNTEKQTSNSISYRLDTGAKITKFSKELYSDSNISAGRIYSWNETAFGPKPESFNRAEYNYIGYRMNVSVERNQPYRLELEDLPDCGGEVVSVYYHGIAYNTDRNSNSVYTAEYNAESGRWILWDFDKLNGQYRSCNTELFVVAAYPRKDMQPGEEIKYVNNATMHSVAIDEHEGDKGDNDQNDLSQKSDLAETSWRDFQYEYNGKITDYHKALYPYESGGVTVLKVGQDIKTNVHYYMSVDGYELRDGYCFDFEDDAVYLSAVIDGVKGEYVRLGAGDYEFDYGEMNGVKVELTCSKLDYDTGEVLDVPNDLPKEPFVFMGRTADGEWVKIKDIYYNPSTSYYYAEPSLIRGKGYTALRLVSPEGLKGKWKASISADMKLKGSSPYIQSLFEKGEVSRLYVENFAQYKTYYADGKGEYHWLDPLEKADDEVVRVKLDETDKDEDGLYPVRRYQEQQVSAVSYSSGIRKVTEPEVENDTVHSKADVTFTVYEYEQIGSTRLPVAVYEEFSQNEGVFYDLLPEGYAFNESKPVTVWQTEYIGCPPGFTTNAAMTSYEVIDNYKDTGRQMVIFHVSAIGKPNKNYHAYSSVMYTGFNIRYTASISWEDHYLSPKGYNIVAFQRGDDRTIAGSYSEQGYPGSKQYEKIYINAPDGTPALKDPDNDGVIDNKNTLYAYSDVNPAFYTTVQSGITKAVKGNSGYYTSDDATQTGNTYSYRISLETSQGGTTSDVVLIDILENAANVDGGTGETGWKGSFCGVKYDSPSKQGVDVKVYYSTASGLTYNDTQDLKLDSGKWTDTPPEDLSTVTAVAFDLRTGKDGQPYIFEDKQNTNVEIIMQAPDEMPGNAVYAYNRPAYWSKFCPKGGNVQQIVLSNGNRTTIRLGKLQDFEFTKMIEDEEGETPIGGAVFSLYSHKGDIEEGHSHSKKMPGSDGSCWESTPIRTVTSTNVGRVLFRNLEAGTYAIVETKAPYAANDVKNCYWTFDLDGTGECKVVPEKVIISGKAAEFKTIEEGLIFVNSRKSKNIYLKKSWSDDREKMIRPETIEFELYRNNILYRTTTFKTDGLSYVHYLLFENIPAYDIYGNLYRYKVKEKDVAGYLSIDEKNDVLFDPANSYISIINKRQGILELKKLVEDGKDPKKRFTFTVRLEVNNKPAAPLDANGEPISYIVRRYASADSSEYSEETADMSLDSTFEVTAAHGERILVLGLPVGAYYTVIENETEGYIGEVSEGSDKGATSSTTVNSVTFTNKCVTAVSVSKIWDDGNDKDKIRPESITVRLYANGEEIDSVQIKAGSDGSWKHEFTHLPRYADGEEIVYTISEDAVEGYVTSIEGTTITNRHTPKTPPDEPDKPTPPDEPDKPTPPDEPDEPTPPAPDETPKELQPPKVPENMKSESNEPSEVIQLQLPVIPRLMRSGNPVGTGDDSNMKGYLALMLAGLAALAGYIAVKRSRK